MTDWGAAASLTSERIEEIAHILDDRQLRRLGGVILSLDPEYVLAVQQAPRAIRQLLGRAAVQASPSCICNFGDIEPGCPVHRPSPESEKP